jgi:hypothetical protein
MSLLIIVIKWIYWTAVLSIPGGCTPLTLRVDDV